MSINHLEVSLDVAQSDEVIDEPCFQGQGFAVRRSQVRPSQNELDLVIEKWAERIVAVLCRHVGRPLHLFDQDESEPSRESEHLPPRTSLETLEAVERLLIRLQIGKF